MIVSFECQATEALYVEGICDPRWLRIKTIARRKLDMLDAAIRVDVLRFPPGNRLQKLSGTRSGQWSIRINDQWRLCFHWSARGPEHVEIVDYH